VILDRFYVINFLLRSAGLTSEGDVVLVAFLRGQSNLRNIVLVDSDPLVRVGLRESLLHDDGLFFWVKFVILNLHFLFYEFII